MPKAIIFTGVPACGKTSYYKEFFGEYVHINLDTLKTRNKEKKLLAECINARCDFVVDNTNPSPEDRARYIQPLKEAGYEIIGYYFSSPISECIERNRKREGKQRIPDKAVAAVYGNLTIPSMSEGFDKLYYVKLTTDGFFTEDWRDDL